MEWTGIAADVIDLHLQLLHTKGVDAHDYKIFCCWNPSIFVS